MVAARGEVEVLNVCIGGTCVGGGEPPYVIAEIGSNHDGSMLQASQLIQAAADAGADAAKFQFYRADKLYPGTITQGAVPDEWLPLLKAACHEAGVEFLCSVFDLETLDAYLAVGPAAVKIASPEATNQRLVAAAADTGLPVIVATGAMTGVEVDRAHFHAGERQVLLHCVSAYPADPGQMNLGVVARMAARYNVPVGLSDHTLDPVVAPVAAVVLGACMVEKHLTLDRSGAGPDHGFALEPGEFALMVEAVGLAYRMRGDGVKRVMASEDATDRRAA